MRGLPDRSTIQLQAMSLESDRYITEVAEGDRYLAPTIAEFDLQREAMIRAVRMHLRVLVTRTTPEVIQQAYPSDWWQAFKDRWYPAWALRRWPVRRTVFRMEKFAVYPEIPWDTLRGPRSMVIPMPVLGMSEWRETDDAL